MKEAESRIRGIGPHRPAGLCPSLVAGRGVLCRMSVKKALGSEQAAGLQWAVLFWRKALAEDVSELSI